VAPDSVDVEAVFPVGGPVAPAGRVHAVGLEGGPAVQALHAGPYDQLHGAYAALERWLQEHGAKPAGPVREICLTGPGVPPAQHETLIVQPIAKG
jgi:effector-binding domain-containing protein